MTETIMNVSNPYDGERRPGTVGLPLPGVELRLAGGDQGEVLLRGPNVFSGYWGNPAATAEAFDPDGWFRTGDLGSFDERGYLRIEGRSKELIITGGYNVHPREVEELLLEHPGVAEAAVVGTPSEEWGEQVDRLRRPRRPGRPARPRRAAGLRRRAAGRLQAAPGGPLRGGVAPQRPRQGHEARAAAMSAAEGWPDGRRPGRQDRHRHRRGQRHRRGLRPPAGRGGGQGHRASTATADGAERVAGELGGTPVTADLTDPAALDGLELAADVLVNNAGFQHVAPVEEFPPERFAAMLALMVEAPFRLARAVLPGMYERGWGRIVNISSVHGLRASPYKSAYVAAKHGLEGLSKVLALEGGPRGVTSNCICPAYVRTPLVEGQIADQARIHGISESEVIERVMLTEPAIKRLLEPAEVADALLYLCSPAAAFVNGTSLVLDGGWTAR